MNEVMKLTEIRLGRLPGIYSLRLWNEQRSEDVSLARTANCCTNLDVDLYCGPAGDGGRGRSEREPTRRLVNGQVTRQVRIFSPCHVAD